MSDNKTIEGLLMYGRRIAMEMGQDSESAMDVAMEAFEQVYEWIKRPYSYLSLEDAPIEKIHNFLYKSIRSRCINIIRKESRQLKKTKEVLTKIIDGFRFGDEGEIKIVESPESLEGPGNLIKNLGPFVVDLNKVTMEKLKEELFFFIEENFGRAKWHYKKQNLEIFFERFQENLTIRELKERHPSINIASLNTDVHRMIKRYLQWASKNGQSDIFNNRAIWTVKD